MRNAFIQTLVELAKVDERIFLLVGDLGYSVVEPFMQNFSDRFVNVGVAEQNLLGVATGLAACDKIVFVYSIANFPTLRCLEQIRNDVCYHNANVKIVAVGGGVSYGTHGITHHATEDLAIMRALPNMTVIAPGDPVEVAMATRAVKDHVGPCYLRLGKSGERAVHEALAEFQIGKAIVVRNGDVATLITTGNMLHAAVQAADELSQQNVRVRVISMHTLKPIDKEIILRAAQETPVIITIEEHNPIGGLGSAVSEVLSGIDNNKVVFRRMDLREMSWNVIGSQQYIRKVSGLSVEGIISTVTDAISQEQLMSEIEQ